ncbi:amidophosphoribosyltransferase [Patescibacteria group bacterium]|nr:amidophosphoribosyltransferase [Patescibacteria group bacterium]
MCGFIGIVGNDSVVQDLYDGLVTIQHRGQDAAGLATYDGSQFHIKKGLGLVSEVFRTKNIMRLRGNIGLGHVRYPTAGAIGAEECQPFTLNIPYGLMLVHNGNLFNTQSLRKELIEKDKRHVNSSSDGEVILNLFANGLLKQRINGKLKPEHIWKAVKHVYARAKGAYSVLIYIGRHGMVAFRDPRGIRPMIWGERKTDLNPEYIFCSERIALDTSGFDVVRDVDAGEAIYINDNHKVFTKKLVKNTHSPCMFEYIYFARPDSMIDEISVYKSRKRMGEKLADQVRKSKLKIDVIVPVPDSSRTAALALAEKLKLKYSEGIVKNRYIGRTFIMPGQAIRQKSIRYKLNAMPIEFKGKKVLLVDDSIVRGNTSRQIVNMARKAGAEKVYFASYAPPVKFPCVYGIDIPTSQELIASNLSVEEVRKAITADYLFYEDLKDAEWACLRGSKKLTKLCTACFSGQYPTGDVTPAVLKRVSDERLAEKSEYLDVADEQLNLL